MTGPEVKQKLGLSLFKHVVVQKVLEGPGNLYIISVDSRYPRQFLAFRKLKNILGYGIFMARTGLQPMRITPPSDLSDYGDFPDNAIFVLRDLAGTHFLNKKFYMPDPV